MRFIHALNGEFDMQDLFVALSQWLRPRLPMTCTALVATILIVFSNDFNRLVRRLVKKWPFVVRLAAFILICSFGYGLLTVFGGMLVARILSHLDNRVLFVVVVCLFLVIGVVAERKRCI